MQFIHDRPDFDFVLRGADGHSARVNDRTLTRSFILAPDRLVEGWSVSNMADLTPEALAPLLALAPELVLLGTGASQVFPTADVQAACLTRGIGLEAMGNASAARTFNVLAGDGRRVVAGFVIDPMPPAVDQIARL